jgi:hypothetical protein
MTAAFTVNPALTGLAISYRNPRLIADSVLPRVPVGTKEYKYHELPIGDAFTVPNTLVGRKGAPNQVEFGMVERSGMVRDYGLEDAIPADDIAQAAAMRAQGASFDPEAVAVQNLMDLVLLDREIRVAARVFAAGTYPVGNRVVLAGASQWSDPASNPITAIGDALDVPVMRPNVAIFGRRAWTRTRRNPALVKAASRSAGDSGQVTREEFRDMFELDEVLVGEGFVNAARPGQAATLARVWGNHCALIRRDMLATTAGQRATFGITAQWGARVAMTEPDMNVGLRGGVLVRAGESVDEQITASRLGFFFENAVA